MQERVNTDLIGLALVKEIAHDSLEQVHLLGYYVHCKLIVLFYDQVELFCWLVHASSLIFIIWFCSCKHQRSQHVRFNNVLLLHYSAHSIFIFSFLYPMTVLLLLLLLLYVFVSISRLWAFIFSYIYPRLKQIDIDQIAMTMLFLCVSKNGLRKSRKVIQVAKAAWIA